MGQFASIGILVVRVDVFFPLGTSHFFRRRHAPLAIGFGFFLFRFFAPLFLAFLLRRYRKRLSELRRRFTQFCFQFVDAPVRSIQLPTQHHDQFDQPIDIDLTFHNILLERRNIHAQFIINSPNSSSANFTD